ncbi:MAG: exonuclease SbcCD subunit D [Muribaculaceae bacterium]|nr:exonuclease SbcCD subunit D [Muribaculaceae bacterium]
MRILHTADIHFGQNIYQHYDRLDEHLHFFSQLRKWIETYSPDVLLISGDIYDVAQPPASVWSAFNSEIVELRRKFPTLAIVMIAGNHDSASRIESHSKVWDMAGVTVVGTPPPLLTSAPEGWEERYVVRIPTGFIIAVPYMSGERTDTMIHLQNYVNEINSDSLPVVMTGHLAAVGCDMEGKNPEIGNLRPVSIDKFGDGYDYLALGHIHKPQTLGYQRVLDDVLHIYNAPVARYSGSVLHVSEDENYSHSVSLVDIDRHKGNVEISQLRIDQLRHFHSLPDDNPQPFQTAEEAIDYLKSFILKNDHIYIRFRFSQNAYIPADFNSSIYTLIEECGKDVRYNPRPIFVASEESHTDETQSSRSMIDIEEIKQMTNPREFIRKTATSYPGLSEDDLDELFNEVEMHLQKQIDE